MITLREDGTYVGPPYQSIPLPLIGDTNTTDVIFCPWCRDLYIQAVTAGLGSGESFTLIVEGSLDGNDWDNLDSADASTSIDSNGTTLFLYSGAITPYVRVRVTSTGGALEDATIALSGYMQVIS